jgi:N-acetylglucosaminyl-diphospho-decaprenol L-rhamnosyltransferase
VSGSLHIVIVNWNTGELLRGCLDSIATAAEHGGVHVVRVTVVDNASTDGSADALDESKLPLQVIRNRRNLGFGAACNQGAAGSDADYMLLLNPDTRLFADTLATVTEFMDGERAAGVGICGIEMVDAGGAPTISCERFPTVRVMVGKMTGLDRLFPRLFPSHHIDPEELTESGPVDQVIGAFYFVRRRLFKRLGGFDSRYFIYFEDVDFALRARRLGYESYFLKEARAFHAANVSSEQVRDFRLFHSLRSRLIYMRVHWSRRQAALIAFLTVAVELPARLARALVRRSRADLTETISAYRMLIADLRTGD